MPMPKRFWWVFALLWWCLVGCERPLANQTPVPANAQVGDPIATDTLQPTPTLASQATSQQPILTPTPRQTATPRPLQTPTPYYVGETIPNCGQLLPLLPPANPAVTRQLNPDSDALAILQNRLTEDEVSQSALQYMLNNPQDVGLAFYRMGDEANGAYLNADRPMPLASVVKIIHLVAYAEAVSSGEISPLSSVTLDTLDAYYLPQSDLNAHPNAIEALEADGLVYGTPDTISLEHVPRMMMQYSSNAATDYLHLLLGQTRLERTILLLGLTSHTAPCPFLGQFLAMGNHTRPRGYDMIFFRDYVADPTLYGSELSLLTSAYLFDEQFAQQEAGWRNPRNPSYDTQQIYANTLNTHGSARDYARLMATIAQNGLSDSSASFLARRTLEWPMRFPANQVQFDNLGYKNGRLPGILTLTYYAYPKGETTPVVIALFFQDLPRQTYQSWRNRLPHDDLARWLLANPDTIPLLNAILQE